MLNKKICAFLLHLTVSCQSIFAITIINQTDSVKIIKLEEAYRPEPQQPGDLEAPISLGFLPQQIKIAAHSVEKIQLRAPARVLMIGITTKTKKGSETITTTSTTCYEPYQGEEYFNDEWGIVIHKPTPAKFKSSFDPYSFFIQQTNEKQGYGILCLSPLLLAKITSLEELPEDLKR
jgi:hypothetical protein